MHDLIRAQMLALSIPTAAELHRRMDPRPSDAAVRAWVAGDSLPAPTWWPALATALGLTVAQVSEADRRDRLAQAGDAA